MDMDEDDDIYAPEELQVQPTAAPSAPAAPAANETKPEAGNDELEEGEEEDEGEDMDEDDDDSVSVSSLPSCYERIAYSQQGYRNRYRAERWHQGSRPIVSAIEAPCLAALVNTSNIARQTITI